VSILERVQHDVSAAMKAGDRDRVRALRLVASELQKAAKEAPKDAGQGEAAAREREVGVLQRERKRRLEAAEAYREGGRDELAAGEEREAELVAAYLPQQLSDDELEAIVGDAVAESGAATQRELGRVMALVMPKVRGRADGRRVSQAVREKLTA
jgi:uncharacterized protein YqeY